MKEHPKDYFGIFTNPSKYSGVCDCEGKPLHGKKFFVESETEIIDFAKYGKTTSLYYLDEPHSKSFKTLRCLVSHYNKKNKPELLEGGEK